MSTAELVSMSAQELDRLMVIERVLEKRLSQVEAAKQLGVTSRHMHRLIGRPPRSFPDGAQRRHSRFGVRLRRTSPGRATVRAAS